MKIRHLECELRIRQRGMAHTELTCLQMWTKNDKAGVGRKLRRTGAQGAELVEMAIVLPLLLTLLIGILWGARAYNIYETITRAAREGARVAVVPTCATCGNAFPSSTTVQTAVDNVLASSNLATSSSGQVTINIQQHQALGLDPLNASANWTVISITYPYQFVLPFTSLNGATINISTQVQMLEEQ